MRSNPNCPHAASLATRVTAAWRWAAAAGVVIAAAALAWSECAPVSRSMEATLHPAIVAPVVEPLAFESPDGAERTSVATATSLRGFVRDDNGVLAGVNVRVFAEPRGIAATALAVTKTNAGGVFNLIFESDSRSFSLDVASAVHEAVTIPNIVAGATTSVRLRQWVTFTGRVRASVGGAPLAGAIVCAFEASSVATDAAGRFELRAPLVLGEATLDARLGGYGRRLRNVRVTGTHANVDFELPPAVTVPLLVIDRDLGAPIAGATLARGDEPPSARTDTAGRCSLDVGPGEEVTMRVEATGYCRLAWTWRVDQVPDNAPRLALQRAALIDGSVLRDDGVPLSGIQVHAGTGVPPHRALDVELLQRLALPGAAADEAPTSTATSTHDGAFALAVVPDPLPYTVRARADGFIATSSEALVLRAPGSATRVELRLARAATVRGTVTRNGRPVRRMVDWVHSDGVRRGNTVTNETGGYLLAQLPPGRVELRVCAPGASGRRVEHQSSLDLAANETAVHHMACDEEVDTVRGRISNDAGEPLAGIAVRASHGEGEGARCYAGVSRDDGTYAVECGVNATCEIWVRHDGLDQRRAPVAAGATGIDFVLPRLGALWLQLVDTNGRPIEVDAGGAQSISWRRSGERDFHCWRHGADSAGVVALRLPIGSVDVRVWLRGEGYRPCTVTGLQVVAAPPAPTHVALHRGADLTLTVVGEQPFSADVRSGHALFVLERAQAGAVRGPFPAGSPEANHRYGQHLWMEDPSLLEQIPSFDLDGVAVLRGLAPGRYTIKCLPDDFVFVPREFVVPLSGARVTLRWRYR